MNTQLSRRARLLVGIGIGAMVVGVAATACNPQPGAAPAPSSTVPTSTSSSAPSSATSTPAPVQVEATTTSTQPTVSPPRPAPVPILGTVWAPSQQGYGTVRPSTISNGGDPTGVVTGVHWQSWGGPTAVATGMSSDPGNGIVADAVQRQATVQAFDLGDCDGKLMYRAIEWYFPADGQTFDPHKYIDICTGHYVG